MDVTVREATSDDGQGLLPLWREFTAHLSAYSGRYAARETAGERWLAYFEDHLLDSASGVVLVAETGGGGDGDAAMGGGEEGAEDGDGEETGEANDVGDRDGAYVGVLQARVVEEHPVFRLGRRGRIDGLFVREDARNRGVGRALLEAAEAWFVEEPRAADFYRIDVVEGDAETAAALRGLDLVPVSRTFEGEA